MNVLEIEAGSIIYLSENDTYLTNVSFIASSIGIAYSAAALGLLILTAILFAEWRRNYKNQLLIQFMGARFFYTCLRYFYDIKHVLHWYMYYENNLYLELFFIMYTDLALVFWMYMFSKQMYDSLVKVFDVESQKLWKVSSVAWLVPAIISMLSILLIFIQGTNFNYYFVYTLFVKWPILIANAVLLILVTRSVLKNNKSCPENNVRIVLVMIVLIFMFCFQQLLLDSCKIIYVFFIYHYTALSKLILSANIIFLYHCATSIMFWVFGNANTRKMWRSIFTILKVKSRLGSRLFNFYD